MCGGFWFFMAKHYELNAERQRALNSEIESGGVKCC